MGLLTGRPCILTTFFWPGISLHVKKLALHCLLYSASLVTKSTLSDSRLQTSSAHLSSDSLHFLITVFIDSNLFDVHIDLFLSGCFLSLINSFPQ